MTGASPNTATEGSPTSVGSIYVHAPFCARRCTYCDFAVTVDRSPLPSTWLEALEGEWRALAREDLFSVSEALDTLFVGGGTPSLLGPDAMEGLARILGLTKPPLEWTVEANPESFSPEVAAAWHRAGVNRVSLGVQTFSPTALAWMGRLHGPDGALRAVRVARQAGFENFSLDLIFGLPDRLERSWSADLTRILDLEPPHVSLYGLTVESTTPLGRAVAEGRETVAGEDRYREEYLEATEALVGAGYLHYEVSNFARPGYQSRHNQAYWTGLPYLGLGNGAHSYLHPLRRWNERDWWSYRELAVRGELAVAGQETLSEDARRLESLWLGLRVGDGLALDVLSPSGRSLCRRWAARGLAFPVGDRVRLTPRGWLVLDRLAVALDEVEGGPGGRREAGGSADDPGGELPRGLTPGPTGGDLSTGCR